MKNKIIEIAEKHGAYKEQISNDEWAFNIEDFILESFIEEIDSLYSGRVSEKEFTNTCMDIIHREVRKYVAEPGSISVAGRIFEKLIPVIKQSHPTHDISEGEIERIRKIINEVHVQINKYVIGDKSIDLNKVKELAIQVILKKWAITKGAQPEVAHCTQCGYHYDSLLKECPTCKGVKPTSEENRENIITEINNEIQPHAITLEHGEKAAQAVYDLIYGKN